MTEREKMAQIIAEYLCPQGKAHARLYGEERMCYSRDNFAECEKVSKCVDALIAADIGDISTWKYRAEVAERALEYAVSEYRCDECPNIECNAEIRGSLECIELICAKYKKEAERDIATEKQIRIDEYLERLNEK